MFCLFGLSLLCGCQSLSVENHEDQKTAAKRYFQGVYSGNTSVVDELASEGIAMSYPIFQTLFNKQVLIGKDAVKTFTERFGVKWKHPRITIHETIEGHNTVVLVWSFQAIDTFHDSASANDIDAEHRWGGISVIKFNSNGRIVSEFGEESEPGPIARISLPIN